MFRIFSYELHFERIVSTFKWISISHEEISSILESIVSGNSQITIIQHLEYFADTIFKMYSNIGNKPLCVQ